jgi:hypothetical protein
VTRSPLCPRAPSRAKSIVPSYRCTIDRTIARPRPTPPVSALRGVAAEEAPAEAGEELVRQRMAASSTTSWAHAPLRRLHLDGPTRGRVALGVRAHHVEARAKIGRLPREGDVRIVEHRELAHVAHEPGEA